MKVIDGKIAEATELELWEHWYNAGMFDLYSFQEYMRRCCAAGTQITETTDPVVLSIQNERKSER